MLPCVSLSFFDEEVGWYFFSDFNEKSWITNKASLSPVPVP
jgi:hypothetical protein